MSRFVKQYNNPRPHDTVFDPLTGLTWAVVFSDPLPFEFAQDYIDSLNLIEHCGRNDWRIPTIKELVSLVDYGRHSPAIDIGALPNTPSARFWSDTRDQSSINSVFTVGFSNGAAASWCPRSNVSYVRAVSGPVYGGEA